MEQENQPKLTLGQRRVRLTFSNDNPLVANIKQKSADLIDFLQAHRNTLNAEYYDKPMSEEMGEAHREQMRIISEAQTCFENAAMWAVKAVTG